MPGLPEVDATAPFISSMREYSNTKTSIIDLWNFSFSNFALSQGCLPKDQNKYGLSGHPDEEAHQLFGKFLLGKYASTCR